jgi:ribonucleotide reductase alpha subunit
MVSYDVAFKASLEYFGGDEMAADVFLKKYSLRDLSGELLETTPDQMHRRLAREFARIEAKYQNAMSEEEIYRLFKGFGFVIPQGSPMAAIGDNNRLQSVGNCFVLASPHDAYSGILKTDQEQVQIMKRRGGVGFDISTIRPRGLATSNAAQTTDGIGVFMERFSNSCREVAQGGRRGALLLSLDVRHPDIETFVTIKQDLKKVTGANVSVKLTDEFIRAVSEDREFKLRWPVDASEPVIERTIKAKELWNLIADSAWKSAEPGVFFWDTVKRETPADAFKKDGFGSVCTNPCLVGDTLVAVADGRGMVPIKQLANEGTDVPVYSLGFDGKIVIKNMKNPRKTGEKVPVFRVKIQNGHEFSATANHKLLTKDGSYIQVSDLKKGDALHIAHRLTAKFHEVRQSSNSRSQDYVWIANDSLIKLSSEHRLIWEHQNGLIPKNYVIHHKNFVGIDNRVENLVCMSKEEHHELHAKNMLGEKNPIHKILSDPDKNYRWKEKRVEHMRCCNPVTKLVDSGDNEKIEKWVVGISSIRTGVSKEFYEIDTIIEHIRSITRNLNRRILKSDWKKFHGPFPISIPTFLLRKRGFQSLTQCFLNIAKDENVLYYDADSNVLFSYAKIKEQGYDAFIENDKVYVKLKCEHCSRQFERTSDRREVSFCSISCLAKSRHSKDETWKKAISNACKSRKEATARKQLDVYLENRCLTRQEWNEACKKSNVSYKLGGSAYFQNFEKLKEIAGLRNHVVESVEFVGYEDVYNGTVEETHNFYFGGFKEKNSKFSNNLEVLLNSKNCGEIVLSPNDSCRLMVLNLTSYVKEPFSPNASFDFALFNEHVVKAQRLMDDLIDIEIEKIDAIIVKVKCDPEPDDVKQTELDLWLKIRDTCVKGRRTGLGITGLGDMLAYLGMRYGSPESVEMTERVYKALAVNAHSSSINLALERGAFPAWYSGAWENHPFMNKLMNECDEKTNALFLKHGRRNICLTTTAPAGTVSLMTQTTSGIEPAFMLKYMRRTKLSHDSDAAEADFVDELGDKWREYEVLHPGFKLWVERTGNASENVELSPYHRSTSADVDWISSIEIQAAAQKWIEHSISKTTNLPENATRELVSDVYMHAWKRGCKGITVYRAGSRSGVLVEKKDEKFVQHSAPKRPKELLCNIHHVNIKNETWTILVGLMDGKPYEIFGGLSRFVEIPKRYDEGVIAKNERKSLDSTYDLKVGNGSGFVIKNIVEQFDNANHSAMTRIISLSLRHGADIAYVVEQLQKDKNSDMFSFAKCIARVLKTYIKDGTTTSLVKKCPQCANEKLIYLEGCISCNCGWSRCS